jgi:DNA-binding protein HU-beta
MAAKKAAKKTTAKKPMNRAELNEAVAKELGVSKAAADRAVGSVLNQMSKGLKRRKKISLVGFGTFDVRSRKRRRGRNPQTGEQIWIAASRSVGFKAGKPLRDSL